MTLTKKNRRKWDRRKCDRRKSENNMDGMNKSSFFNSFSPEDKSTFLASPPDFIKFNPGEMIVRKGDIDRSVYIILVGSAKVLKSSGRSELVFGRLEAGEIFGEISLLRKGGRTFDVKAEIQTVVISITAKHIKSLPVNIQSKMKSQFLKIMLGRFKDINRKYTELLSKNTFE